MTTIRARPVVEAESEEIRSRTAAEAVPATIRARPVVDAELPKSHPAEFSTRTSAAMRAALGDDLPRYTPEEVLAEMERDLERMAPNDPGRAALLRAIDMQRKKVGFQLRSHSAAPQPESAAPRAAQADIRRTEPVQPAETPKPGSLYSTIGSILGGLGGTVAGAMAGAPFGPKGAIIGGILGSLGGSTAGTAVGTWADLSDGQEITDEQAHALMRERLIENAVMDVAGNVIFLGGGKAVRWAANTPKGKALLKRYFPKLEIAPSAYPTREQMLIAQENETVKRLTRDQDPLTRAAVADLVQRDPEGFVPTRGEITGERHYLEELARKFHPDIYAEQKEAMLRAARASREARLGPASRGAAQTDTAFGERINAVLDDVEELVKSKTRPAFEAAQKIGVVVDASDVRNVARQILGRDDLAARAALKPSERAYLESLVAVDSTGAPIHNLSNPSGILDFISATKERMRGLSADDQPSKMFKTALTKLTETAEAAYMEAAKQSKNPNVYRELMDARELYREMMETVYDPSMRAVMRASPERAAEKIAAVGNVEQIKNFNRVLEVAKKHGALSDQEIATLRSDLVHNFLSNQIHTIDDAAKWTERLASDPKLGRSWKALMETPGMNQYHDMMRLLERQAQIVQRTVPARGEAAMLRLGQGLSAAAFGYWVGGIPGALGFGFVGIHIDKVMKLIALSQVKGSGVYAKDVAMLLRATTPGFAGGRATIEALKRLNEAAKANGIDLFEPVPEAAQPEEKPK